MPKGGLEPPRAIAHCALNAARLPVPPLRREKKISFCRWSSQRKGRRCLSARDTSKFLCVLLQQRLDGHQEQRVQSG
jgi:hypothetical protein